MPKRCQQQISCTSESPPGVVFPWPIVIAMGHGLPNQPPRRLRGPHGACDSASHGTCTFAKICQKVHHFWSFVNIPEACSIYANHHLCSPTFPFKMNPVPVFISKTTPKWDQSIINDRVHPLVFSQNQWFLSVWWFTVWLRLLLWQMLLRLGNKWLFGCSLTPH